MVLPHTNTLLPPTFLLCYEWNILLQDDVTSRWSWASRQLLSLSLFSLRLLQWWYSGENEAAVRRMNSLPVPPPPLPTQVSLSLYLISLSLFLSPAPISPYLTPIPVLFDRCFLSLSSQPTPPVLTDPFTCPLCHQTRRDPTTLATSG